MPQPELRIVSNNDTDTNAGERTDFKVSYGNIKDTDLGYMSTDELYPLQEENLPVLYNASKLLDEAKTHFNEALSSSEPFQIDLEILQVQVLLPELFCCRSLGDGFGSLIVAIYHALNNRKDALLSREQLLSLKNCIQRLHTEPFISGDEAVDQVMLLEDAGFIVEPMEFDYIAELLDE